MDELVESAEPEELVELVELVELAELVELETEEDDEELELLALLDAEADDADEALLRELAAEARDLDCAAASEEAARIADADEADAADALDEREALACASVECVDDGVAESLWELGEALCVALDELERREVDLLDEEDESFEPPLSLSSLSLLMTHQVIGNTPSFKS